MPVFTQVLKDVLDRHADIGLTKYPTPKGVDADAFRTALNGKIIRHYYNREIGLESTSIFVYNMQTKMGEIMPFYVKLYESELIQFDPLSTMDITSKQTAEGESESTGEATSAGSSENDSKAYNSTFPQQMVVDNDASYSKYADNATTTHGDGSSTGTQNETRKANETNNSENTTKGYSGSAASLLNAYRATLLNVDMAVIADLEELFMQVFDTGDTYTGAY